MRWALLLAVLLAAPPALSQSLPDPASLSPFKVDPSDPAGSLTRAAEVVAGTNLTQEDVRVLLDADFQSLSFDALGVVFGGGDFSAKGRLTAHVEFRAINVSHLADPLPEPVPRCQSSAAANRTCHGVLTAGALRASLTGAALDAFEAQEAGLLSRFLATSFPDATILNTVFAWSNVQPEPPSPQAPAPNAPTLVSDSREPPIVLDVTLDVQYLKRESLVHIVETALDKSRLTPQEQQAKADRQALLERVRGGSTGALYERSAFDILGIDQVVVMEAPAGWDVAVTLRLPKGYTYEYASPDVVVGPGHDEATTVTLAGTSLSPVSNPIAVSLSNRFLVAVALTGSVLLVGAILRLPTMLLAGRVARRR